MTTSALDASLRELILKLVPQDGSAIGNTKLQTQLAVVEGLTFAEEDYHRVRDALIAEGLLAKGQGKGGAVKRTQAAPADELVLAVQDVPDESEDEPQKIKARSSAPRGSANQPNQVLSYRYDEKRKNNPHVGMVDTHSDGVEEEKAWYYDPHIDPALQFDSSRSKVESLIDEALASGDAAQMQAALEQLKRMQSPYLNWAGKAERTSFEVDTVSLHVHERIDPATILAAVQKRIKDSKGKSAATFQSDLFHAPFENLPLREAIDFYKHERDWANRLIAGDSLLVMNSLLQKEGMAGRVQMAYFDPPYGIKYGSNFQPFVNKRDVKDGRDEDLTQEPEMIKAFRDTWELGIHSYLTYIRDRLLLTKDLLSESGSVFVQISDENVHLIRNLMDEIFGSENFAGQIVFTKTSGLGSELLSRTKDFIIWYAKDISKIKFNRLKRDKVSVAEEDSHYSKDVYGNLYTLSDLTGQFSNTPSCLYDFPFRGDSIGPSKGRQWKTTYKGMTRLHFAGRIQRMGGSIRYARYLADSPTMPITDVWSEIGGSVQSRNDPKVYVVQTGTAAVQRCILMTTDPGDLVIDPTCGSGTTAYVAEKWGRRWITCDTSRVAVTLAKQRLMTAGYEYFDLKYPHEGLRGGFVYKTVPHVTLKSIANNPEIDSIYARMHSAIEAALNELNSKIDSAPLSEWEVPFELPNDVDDSVKVLFEKFHNARKEMQKKMDESIASHADMEVLYDQPYVSKSKLRITGPFTVEAVPFATVLGLDEAEQPRDADVAVARSGATARQVGWRDELLKAGIRGKGGQKMKLLDLQPLPGARYVHAIGTVAETGEKVAVSFGPEHAALEQRQVEIAMREAGDLFPLPKMLVFCAFTFDPEAAKDIDNIKGITALKVQMNTDLLTEDLKKGRASNESFWLMGQPDVSIKKLKDGQYQVEVNGFDYFDTKTGELKSGGKKNIALWALDTDYDNRSLYPRQVFFPIAGKGEGWERLKKDIRAELNEDLLDKFHGTVSLPFMAGDNQCVAVKIVDDRGIESLKVMRLDQV